MVVGSKLVSSKIRDENGIKAMPGSIPSPNSGSFENEKNTGTQMGHNNFFVMNQLARFFKYCKNAHLTQ